MLTAQRGAPLAAMFPHSTETADVHRYNALQPGAMDAAVNYYRANATGGEDYGKVRCRTLVIWGLDDVALDATTCLVGLAEHVMEKPEMLEIRALEATGHFVVDERPETVVEMVGEWLGKK